MKVLRNADTDAPLRPEDECKPGESGYVWLNTPALMKGYFQRDDLTANAVRDGWFLTGDIGFLDEQGRLALRGRERDEINKGGMKIIRPMSTPSSSASKEPPTWHLRPRRRNLRSIGRHGRGAGRPQCAGHPQSARLDEIPPGRAQNAGALVGGRRDSRTSRGKINREAVKAACLPRPSIDLAGILAEGKA